MYRTALVCLGWLLTVSPASALTTDHGVVVFTQADALAGNITPGDTPGFPVTISRPGSYRLASALTVTTQANGIEVRANEVTIDMGGFTLAGSGVGRNGITSFNRNMKVQHGTVRGFTLDGIRSVAQFLAVEDMVVTANGRNGVNAEGTEADVAHVIVGFSRVSSNGSNGIVCGSYCIVQNNSISTNTGWGILFTGIGCLAMGNSVSGNGTGIFFNFIGGAGNNTVVYNGLGNGTSIGGAYSPLQPNACSPACLPP
jgi:hypothetical protein